MIVRDLLVVAFYSLLSIQMKAREYLKNVLDFLFSFEYSMGSLAVSST